MLDGVDGGYELPDVDPTLELGLRDTALEAEEICTELGSVLATLLLGAEEERAATDDA